MRLENKLKLRPIGSKWRYKHMVWEVMGVEKNNRNLVLKFMGASNGNFVPGYITIDDDSFLDSDWERIDFKTYREAVRY